MKEAKKDKTKTGRKPIEIEKITPELLFDLATKHLRKCDIADALEMSSYTFYEKVNSVPEFSRAIKKGRSFVRSQALRTIKDLAGDPGSKQSFIAAKFILEKIGDQDLRHNNVDLSKNENIADYATAIMRALSDGEICVEKAERMLTTVEKYTNILQHVDLADRIKNIEAHLKTSEQSYGKM